MPVKQAASQMLTPGAPVESEKEAHKSLRSLQDHLKWFFRTVKIPREFSFQPCKSALKGRAEDFLHAVPDGPRPLRDARKSA